MIYQILPKIYDYKTMHLSDECVQRHFEREQAAQKLGDESGLLSIIYDKMDVSWFDDPDRATPDIAEIDGHLAFNQRALACLVHLMPQNAERIPFKVDGEDWTLINLRHPRDPDLEEISDEDTLFMAMHEPGANAVLRFKESAALPELFYIEAADLKFFCQDGFKAAYEDNNLTGIVITEDLITRDYELVS